MCRLTKLIPGLEIQKVNEIKQVVHFFVMVDAKGRGGASPLHIACSRDTGYIIHLQLSPGHHQPTAGVPVDARDNDGNTALHRAACKKSVDTEVIHSPLQNGA